MFTLFLKSLWLAVATDVLPVVVPAKSSFQCIGYPDCAVRGLIPAQCCSVKQPCCKLPHIEHKHVESWKPCMERAVNLEDCGRD